jgi:pyrimidine-nucleoside phosphorylase
MVPLMSRPSAVECGLFRSSGVIPAQIIASKRDGHPLSDAEVTYFISRYAADEIPDYQMAALAMAIFLNGMTRGEIEALTREMLRSGTMLTWPEDGQLRVDKHSTGGVGDKTSLILAPLLAECGLQVPMLSGRGLGPTGGTLDKLESIPGFRTDLSLAEISQLTQQIGCVITGTTAELAPADRKLYALRDVTATVPSIPLITASIMSKKLAESLDALVLDVKYGSGGFMKTQQQAEELARSLVDVGSQMGVATTALLTDMNQPLGRMCGNAVEVLESIEVLQGGGPEDVREVTFALAEELLLETRVRESRAEARGLLEARLADGSAYERFCRMVRAQGGDVDAVLLVAPAHDVVAAVSGYVAAVDTEALGHLIIAMGGGRQFLGAAIDPSVGVEMLVRIGDQVEAGQPLMRLFHSGPEGFVAAALATVKLARHPAVAPALISQRVTGNNSR